VRMRVLLHKGPFTLMFEPADVWVGWFRGETYHYVALVPMFPLRIQKLPW
jgi:hypothetical protein